MSGQGLSPEVGGVVAESLGQGLGNVAESAAPSLTPAASLAGDLAAQAPDEALTKLAEVDIPEPTLADAPGGDKLAELGNNLRDAEVTSNSGSSVVSELNPNPPPEIGKADRAMKANHDAEGNPVPKDAASTGEAGDESGQPPKEPPTAEAGSAGEPEDDGSIDPTKLPVEKLTNDQVGSELARLSEAAKQGPLSETDQKRLDFVKGMQENIDRNAEGLDALLADPNKKNNPDITSDGSQLETGSGAAASGGEDGPTGGSSTAEGTSPYTEADFAEASDPNGGTPREDARQAQTRIETRSGEMDALVTEGARDGVNGTKLEGEPDKVAGIEGDSSAQSAVDNKDKPNLQRRDELSKKVLDGTATDDEKAEFKQLVDAPFSNGEIDVNSAGEVSSQNSNLNADIEEMGMQDIAQEQERLSNLQSRNPEEEARLQKLNEAWESRHAEVPPTDDEIVAKYDAMTDEQKRGAAESLTPGTQEEYKKYQEIKRYRDEKEAFDNRRPIDAREGEDYDKYKAREAALFKYKNGEDISEADADLIKDDVEIFDNIRDKMDRGKKLAPYEEVLRSKYDLQPQRTPTDAEARDKELGRLQDLVNRGKATPEDVSNYQKLRAESNKGKKDSQRRDELSSKLITEGKLEPQLEAELNALNEKLGEKEFTDEEKDAEVDRLYEKMGKDLMEGKDLDPDDLEKFRQMKADKTLRETGVEAGRKTIMEEISKRAKSEAGKLNRRETEIERRTKEQLAIVMNLEMQMLAIPRTLSQLAEQQRRLKNQINAKKSEIGRGFSDTEAQAKRRTELYPLMMSLARNKGVIGHYKAAGAILRAEYKSAMADLNRSLRLNGRFGIVPDLFQHFDAMLARAYADVKVDVESLYGSDESQIKQAA